MLKWLIGRRLAAFERDYHYDTSYTRDILDADPWALIKFSKIMGMAHYRKGVPPEAWYAAQLAATLAEDCGPCTQLVVTMAERDGVAPPVLRAVVARDTQAMPEPVALAYRFAQAVLARDPEANGLREQIVERWGKRGLVSLAFVLASARIFPTVKYAMGHGQSCTRVTVDGATMPVAQPQVA